MKIFILLIMSILFLSSDPGRAHTYPEEFLNKKFTINFHNTSLRNAVELLAKKVDMKIVVSEDVKSNVSFSFKNISARDALDRMSNTHNFSYTISKHVLYITNKSTDSSGNIAQGSSINSKMIDDSRLIKLKYLIAKDIEPEIRKLLKEKENLIIHSATNSIAVLGSELSIQKVKSFIKMFDIMPQQILIEAQIVEINKNMSKELGLSYGDLDDPTLVNATNVSGAILNPSPKTPNFALKAAIGQVDGRRLFARILAAETNGDAEVISRPKIMTINNQPANITSGITYNVKTLSTASDSTDSSAVTSGVAQITAGLTLSVTPTIVGDNKVKLVINVVNSEADESTAVDGIPGIIDNSAQTTIIVNNSQTATMAGLIKNSHSKSESGVPWLSKIPFIGWLFKSKTSSDRDKELLILITPKIIKI
jgi:type IV pilus assembly protein PilQ